MLAAKAQHADGGAETGLVYGAALQARTCASAGMRRAALARAGHARARPVTQGRGPFGVFGAGSRLARGARCTQRTLPLAVACAGASADIANIGLALLPRTRLSR